MYLDLRRLSQAERAIRQAEAERGFENDDGGRPWRVHSLAVLWFNLGDLAKAEAFSRRAVQLWESDPGVKDESLAFALNLRAAVLMKLNRGDEAMLVVRRMLGLMSGITLIPPLSRAQLLSGCAEVMVFAGSPAEAEALASEAVGIAQNFPAPLLAPILSSQAAVLRKLNRKGEAKKVAERARRIVQSAGRDPTLSVIDVHELARER